MERKREMLEYVSLSQSGDMTKLMFINIFTLWSGWVGVNFLHSSQYCTVFWISHQSTVDKNSVVSISDNFLYNTKVVGFWVF